MSGAPLLTPDSFECSCAGGPPRLCRSRWAGGAVLHVAAERLGAGVHEHRRRHAAVDRLPVLHGEPNRCLFDTIQLVDQYIYELTIPSGTRPDAPRQMLCTRQVLRQQTASRNAMYCKGLRLEGSRIFHPPPYADWTACASGHVQQFTLGFGFRSHLRKPL